MVFEIEDGDHGLKVPKTSAALPTEEVQLAMRWLSVMYIRGFNFGWYAAIQADENGDAGGTGMGESEGRAAAAGREKRKRGDGGDKDQFFTTEPAFDASEKGKKWHIDPAAHRHTAHDAKKGR